MRCEDVLQLLLMTTIQSMYYPTGLGLNAEYNLKDSLSDHPSSLRFGM